MIVLRTLLIAIALLFFQPVSFANESAVKTGTVAETMSSGGYVYVRLEEDDTWIASRPTMVSVGDTVTYTGGAVMKDFVSKSLNRSFDYIVFVGSLEVATRFDSNDHANAAASDQYDIEKSATAGAPKAGEITPLEGGKTIADIRAEAQQLKDQQVALRARVMKISMNILGKNWITLQDGSETTPGHKLLATSEEVVAVGDLVTVNGVIHTDIDLGSGYKYAVIVENATFSK